MHIGIIQRIIGLEFWNWEGIFRGPLKYQAISFLRIQVKFLGVVREYYLHLQTRSVEINA